MKECEKVPAYVRHHSSQRVESVAKKVMHLLETEKKYRWNDYSARQLAADVQTDLRTLSVALNWFLGENFASLMGRLRAEDARRLIDGGQAHAMSVDDLAAASAFLSRSSFINAFKKLTGETPGKYMKKRYNKTL